MTDELPNDDDESVTGTRRTLLKGLAAAGLLGAGTAATSGTAAADKNDDDFEKLKFDVEKTGEIVSTTDVVNNNDFPVGTDATFDGTLEITDLDVNESGELVASGKLKGKLKSNPVQNINETFDMVLGLLEDILGVLSPDSPGECPILELVVGPIFLDLLGLQIETNTIEIDITAVAGEGNLLGNLLCAVAGLLDP